LPEFPFQSQQGIKFCISLHPKYLLFFNTQEWWTETLEGLERLFRLDADFSETMWAKQKAVIRGQGYNLVESLRRGGAEGGSPMGLLRRPVVAVFDDDFEEDVKGLLQRTQQKRSCKMKPFKVQNRTTSRSSISLSLCEHSDSSTVSCSGVMQNDLLARDVPFIVILVRTRDRVA
jgi:hypothetical protein